MTTPTSFKRRGLLSSSDIAKRLGVHRTTVWHWIKSGMLRSVKVTPRFSGVTEDDLKLFQSNWVGGLPDVSPKTENPSRKKKVAKAKATRRRV